MKKRKKDAKLTLEEIERDWGSLQAFIEEQRRCGMWQLEDYTRQTAKARSFQNQFLALKSDYLGKFKREILDSTALKVEAILSTREKNYLSFLRWLYLSGRIES